MSNLHDIKSRDAVIAQAVRHINHHGGGLDAWFVGIEEKGSDRDARNDRHPIHFLLPSEDDAKSAMSQLLDMGLQADDEYGVQPVILFVYTPK
jgi:hypothetical protein